MSLVTAVGCRALGFSFRANNAGIYEIRLEQVFHKFLWLALCEAVGAESVGTLFILSCLKSKTHAWVAAFKISRNRHCL